MNREQHLPPSSRFAPDPRLPGSRGTRTLPRRVPAWLAVLLVGLVALTVQGIAADPAPPPPPRVEADPAGPAWVPGYRIRWPLRLVGDHGTNERPRSVIALIPGGGWLKPDGSDITVQSADGTVIPMRIVSHDPTGNTIVQFERQGSNRWYWAYGVNPNAPPAAPDPIELVPRPAKPEPKPAESNAVPAEAAAPPAESNAVPAVAAAPPAESNAAPVEAEIELVELPPGPVAPIVHPLAEGLTMEVRE
ncbi:hypothetical protein HQ590_02940, partial [bacterium]|nr:hypothetical protein [bacterium]